MSVARRAAVALLLAVAALVVAGGAVSGSAGRGQPARSYSSDRYGFELQLPFGWQRARARLVPLLMPREILSAGTFPMPAGGGGNCDREPIAAIERMPNGGALVSVQEYEVSAAMRARVGTGAAPPPLAVAVGALDLRRAPYPRARGAAGRSEARLWSETLAFTARGRWFDFLVYAKGDPSPARMGQIRRLLGSLRFEAGSRA